jgi:hypothetical protein
MSAMIFGIGSFGITYMAIALVVVIAMYLPKLIGKKKRPVYSAVKAERKARKVSNEIFYAYSAINRRAAQAKEWGVE